MEPLDRAAGPLPGALNRCFKDKLQADGCFKPAEQLRAEFTALVPDPTRVVQPCGSGVTACHNLLAMVHAGLGDTRLYPGSLCRWAAKHKRC